MSIGKHKTVCCFFFVLHFYQHFSLYNISILFFLTLTANQSNICEMLLVERIDLIIDLVDLLSRRVGKLIKFICSNCLDYKGVYVRLVNLIQLIK